MGKNGEMVFVEVFGLEVSLSQERERCSGNGRPKKGWDAGGRDRDVHRARSVSLRTKM